MTHNPLTSLEMARLHVKIVWLSVATITTFFYGSWKLNSSRLSSTNHDSYYHIWKLKVKFLQESNEPKTHSKLRQNIAFWEKIYFQQLLVEICLDLYSEFCFQNIMFARNELFGQNWSFGLFGPFGRHKQRTATVWTSMDPNYRV